MPQNLDQLPHIVLTMGDPAGVGPEIVLKALADDALLSLARWTIAGDSRILQLAAEQTGVPVPASVAVRHMQTLGDLAGFKLGGLSACCGAAAVAYVREATEMCLRGEAGAMCTGPLNKEAVAMSGMPFSGHTEYIAELCGVSSPRMLLASDKLCTVHVTTHIALRTACQLDQARIERTIELGDEAMRLLGFAAPRIAVCGLNPHAGEHGLFGDEDEQAIVPAIAAARSRGIDCSGPHAGDTIFLQAVRGAYDLVVAMYHDQGHIPMKLLDFEQAVNISLGIPIIRTSVDHGTAFNIAGKNQADARSMKQAMRMAVRMAHGRRKAAAR